MIITANASRAAGTRRIIVITMVSILIHGLALAYLWQAPSFETNTSNTTLLSLQLSKVSTDTANKDNTLQQETTKIPAKTSTFQPEETASQPAQAPQQRLEPNKIPHDVALNEAVITKQSQQAMQPIDTPPSQPADSLSQNATEADFPLPSQHSTPSIAVAPSMASLDESRDTLRLELHKHIDRTYPLMAKKRGWQGKVLLGFKLTPLGKLEDIRVLSSSGHSVLDKSAVKSLSKINELTLAKTLLQHELDMDLSIAYYLQDL